MTAQPRAAANRLRALRSVLLLYTKFSFRSICSVEAVSESGSLGVAHARR